MLHNEPVDIMAIASTRKHYWSEMVRCTMQMQYSAYAQQQYDRYWAEYRVASDDMDAVQALIRELARSE